MVLSVTADVIFLLANHRKQSPWDIILFYFFYYSICQSLILTFYVIALQLHQLALKTLWQVQQKLHWRQLKLRKQPCMLSHSIRTNWRRLWKQRYRSSILQHSQQCGGVTVILVHMWKWQITCFSQRIGAVFRFNSGPLVTVIQSITFTTTVITIVVWYLQQSNNSFY